MELKGMINAWLSPRGELIVNHNLFYNNCAWHEELAGCIIMDMIGLEKPFKSLPYVNDIGFNYRYEYLESIGWIRLHGMIKKPVWVLRGEKRPTKAQENKILDWCIENNVKYNECFL